MLFLAFAYIVKFKSITKSESIQAADDNVWNDKFSDDFMRYIKSEMYNVCHFSMMMIYTFGMGLGRDYEMENIGRRDIWPTKVLFFIMNITQIFYLSIFVYSLMKGILVTSQKAKKFLSVYVVVFFLDIIIVCAIFFGTN